MLKKGDESQTLQYVVVMSVFRRKRSQPQAPWLPLEASEQSSELELVGEHTRKLIRGLADEVGSAHPLDANDCLVEMIDERVQRLVVASGGGGALPPMPDGPIRLYSSAGFTAPGLATPGRTIRR